MPGPANRNILVVAILQESRKGEEPVGKRGRCGPAARWRAIAWPDVDAAERELTPGPPAAGVRQRQALRSPAKLARFEALLAQSEIEPRDWMPDRLPGHAGATDLAATRIPRSWGCSRRPTGSPGRPACAASPSDREGAGRGGPRAVPVLGGRNPWCGTEGSAGRVARRPQQYLSFINYPTLTWATPAHSRG